MTLTALGWTVMHSLWVCTLVAGLAALMLSVLSDRHARTRHAVAYTSLAVMVIAPVALALGGVDPLGSAARFPILQAVDNTVGLQAVATGRAVVVPGAAILWLMGVLVCAARIGREWHRARQLTRCDLATAGEPVDRLLTELRTRLSLRAPVTVCRSRRATVPMVLGWLQPLILLPAGTADTLPRQQLRAVLAHELAHVRRRDYLANLVQIVAETLLFHHPAARWVSRRIRSEREYCCDDVALSVGSDPTDYARALAALDDARDDCRLVVAAASGTLLDRIQRIVGHPRPMLTPAGGVLAFIAASAVAAILLALTAVVPPNLPLDVQFRTRSAAQEAVTPSEGLPATPRTLRR